MNVTPRILASLGLALFILEGCGTTVIEPIDHAPADLGGNSTSGSGGAGGGAPCAPFDAGAPRTGPDKRVVDMTAADAHDWCESYVFQVYPNASLDGPPMKPPNPDPFTAPVAGYIGGYATSYCWQLVAGGGCVVRPTVDDCVTNLLHAPCEATIASLDDCATSFFNGQAQACTPVGQGCTAFVDAPNCQETFVTHVADQPVNTSPSGNPACYLRLAPTCGH